MPTLLFQGIILVTNILVFIFIGHYFLEFRAKEKELEKKQKLLEEKEGKVDTNYHQVVDTALAKERKIIEDATAEADQIIAGAQMITQETKEEVNHNLATMVVDIQKEALDTSRNYMENYQVTLKQITMQSLTEIQNITKGMENDLQAQIKQFHDTLLPGLKKEVDEYKQARMAEIDRTVIRVVQKVSQEILNKSITVDDHQNLLIQSLEKAKREGVFD